MKKTILFFLLSTFWLFVNGQITSDPAFPTENQAVTIYFDATDTPLASSTTDIYMHAGVVTDQSNGLWSHVKSGWGENLASCKLTKVSGDQYKVVIGPSVREFYDVPTSEKILKFAFVFRNAAASAQTSNLFYEVYDDGLHVRIDDPSTSPLITSPKTFTIKAVASVSSALTITVDAASIATVTGTEITGTYEANTPGAHEVKVTATANGETVEATRLITYKGTVVYKALPEGVESGINYSADGTSATLVFDTPIYSNPSNTNYITDVYLIGDFNNWVPQTMYRSTATASSVDSWWITVDNLTPGEEYAFQYMASNKGGKVMRVADPYANKVMDQWNDKWINSDYTIYPGIRAFPEEQTTGIAAVLQPGKAAYNWEVTNFDAPDKSNLLIYEMWLRDFTTEGSVAKAMEKLDYLQNLGVNTIELMPITEFDGNLNWGYSPAYFFAADKAYGREVDYKKFIDECHKRGMAVILDMVFNHCTGNSPFAQLYWDDDNNRPLSVNPWLNVTAPHSYSVYNDFRHTYTGTKNYLKRSLKYWMEEYKVDGFRMDLAKGFTQNSNTDGYNSERIGILKDYYDYVKSVKPSAYFALEFLGDSNEEKAYVDYGMLSWDKMADPAKQCNMGFATGSDLSDASAKLNRGWGNDYLIAYQESHDEEKQGYYVSQYGIDKSDNELSFKRMATTAALFSAIPGPKMLWQFEELAYNKSLFFDPDTNTNNEDSKMKAKPAHWEWTEDADRMQVYNAYSKMLSLRNKYPEAFINGTVEAQVGSGDWTLGKRVCIKHATMNMVIVANFQSSAISSDMSFPHTGMWYDLMTGATLNVTNTHAKQAIPARDFRCYVDQALPADGVENLSTDEAQTVYAVYDAASQVVELYASQAIVRTDLYSVSGAKVATAQDQPMLHTAGLASGCYIARVLLADGSILSCKVTK